MISLRKLTPLLLAALTIGGFPLITKAQTAQAIDPRADKLLQSASNYLKSAQSYSFQAYLTFDDVFPPDLKIQYHSAAKVFVDRPNAFQINYEGERRNVSFYYDGKDLTLFDRRDNVYGTLPAASNIDSTLNSTLKDFGFLVPLSDFIYSNPAQAFAGKIQKGYYLGMVSLQGKNTHHLAFTEQDIDWQVWIEDGNQPLVRQLVISYKNLPSAPKYSVFFPQWDFNWKAPNTNFFMFNAPENAVKIDFLPVLGSANNNN